MLCFLCCSIRFWVNNAKSQCLKFDCVIQSDDYLSGVSLFKHLCEIIKHLISCCSQCTDTLAHTKHTDSIVTLLSESICKMSCLLFQQNRNQLALWLTAVACPFRLTWAYQKSTAASHSTHSNVYLSLVVMYIIAIRFDFKRFSIFSKSPLHTST